jgi:hypothetical protein
VIAHFSKKLHTLSGIEPVPDAGAAVITDRVI